MNKLDRLIQRARAYLISLDRDPRHIPKSDRRRAMRAAVMAIVNEVPDHPFGEIPANQFGHLADLYELEIRRIRGEKRKRRNPAAIALAQRVHDAKAAGMKQSAIALKENISEGRVSQILSKPRPE